MKTSSQLHAELRVFSGIVCLANTHFLKETTMQQPQATTATATATNDDRTASLNQLMYEFLQNPADQDLLERAANALFAKDSDFSNLVLRIVRKRVYRHVGNQSPSYMAAELSQDLALKILATPESFRHYDPTKGSFTAYAHRVAGWLLLDKVKKEKRINDPITYGGGAEKDTNDAGQSRPDDYTEAADSAATPMTVLSNMQANQAYNRAVANLDVDERAVYDLLTKDLTNQQCAEATEVSLATWNRRKASLIAKLSEVVQAHVTSPNQRTF